MKKMTTKTTLYNELSAAISELDMRLVEVSKVADISELAKIQRRLRHCFKGIMACTYAENMQNRVIAERKN